MSKDKKLIPELRFPEFLNKGEWKEKKLGDCLIQNPEYGINAPAVPFSDKLATYLRITDISEDGRFLSNDKVSVDRDVAENNYLSEGDIVLARTGASVGKSYKYRNEDGRLVFAGFLIRVKSDRSKLNSEFLFQFLSTNEYWKWVSFISARSGQPGINGTEFSSMPISLPSTLKEQQKIASCLSSLDEVIATHSQKLELLKEYKKGLMQNLFPQDGEKVPKYRFPEFVKDGQWGNATVEKLIHENILFAPKDGNHGNMHPKSSDYVEKGIPFIMASDLKNGKVDFTKCAYLKKEQADSLQKGFSKSGDILLSHKGTVGEVALLGDIEFPYVMLTPQVTYYRIKDIAKMSNGYLAAFFNSNLYQNKLFDVSGGGTRAYVGITEQQKLKIIYPIRIEEQQKIASCISALDELITAQTKKIEQLKLHKKGLMQGLFPRMSD